ncbi:MAG: AMIN domain-containing protein, partial [Mariprofundus sp.]|nr:AMIN domain-containing protein [Mariprofundus sp.]
MKSTVRHLCYAVVTMFMCLLSPAVHAATIQAMNLLLEGGNENLHVSIDEAVAYQVFNLEGPSRLVIQFPATTLAPEVILLKGKNAVDQIVPTADSDGARVEVTLTAGSTYQITEKGNDLLLSFKPKLQPAQTVVGAVIHDIEVRDQGKVTELILRGEHMDANHNALV